MVRCLTKLSMRFNPSPPSPPPPPPPPQNQRPLTRIPLQSRQAHDPHLRRQQNCNSGLYQMSEMLIGGGERNYKILDQVQKCSLREVKTTH